MIGTHVNQPLQLPRRFESAQLKQVKITVSSDVASAFKKACIAAKVSMALKLSEFMAEYSDTVLVKKEMQSAYSTKRRRRAAIHKTIKQLKQIRELEIHYCDRIPENLHGAPCYENAEDFISHLDSAIEELDQYSDINVMNEWYHKMQVENSILSLLVFTYNVLF